MGSGKTILLVLRVLAPLIALGLTGLGVWCKHRDGFPDTGLVF